MKISVDGGALNLENNQRFGTAVFSENLVKALLRFDKSNHYIIYTLNKLKPRLAWSKIRLSIEEFRQKKDIFLALNQAIPFYSSGKIISFCHGLSYRFYPKLYSKSDVIRLNKQLREMIKRSDKIIVSSQKVGSELISIDRSIENKIAILPFGIPFDMKRASIKNKQRYLLFIGMDHQIKNIDFIKLAFNELKKDKKYMDYKLYILTENVSRLKLKKLYQKATALLTASYYESFNFPVLEALSQGCPVIGLESAIIPELRSYVNLANSLEEFVENMKKIAKKPDVQSINRLYSRFNWKNYVKNLVRLYKQL